LDINFFLKLRTEFIRFFYAEAVKSFLDIQHKIEKGLPPFNDPPYSEDPEPPFLEEWMNAATGINVVGQSCVSLLSDSLKLYFNTLQTRVIGFVLSDAENSATKGQGFVALYKNALGEILDTDWTDCPARFDVIEQVVLARNRSQHGSSLLSHQLRHDPDTLRKHPLPFFASDQELQEWRESGRDEDSYFAPMLEITKDKLFEASHEIEKLANWIEGRMDKAWEWRRRAAGAG